MKVAIYNRGRQLAIREQPSADAEVIGTIGSGCAVRVEDAAPGWLELLGGGYINAAFVTVGTLMRRRTPSASGGRSPRKSRPSRRPCPPSPGATSRSPTMTTR